MNSQPSLPDMDAGPPGRMYEQTFNEALADALRSRRKAWRDDEYAVIAERYGVFDDGDNLRPDILVRSEDTYPVVVEVEFGNPAVGDALDRLGNQVTGMTELVRSAIAVGVPAEVRRWSNSVLKARLSSHDGLKLHYVIFSAKIRGNESEVSLSDEDINRWPPEGFITGTVDDLAILCEYAAAPEILVSQTTDEVARDIQSFATYLHNALPQGVASHIAQLLGQQQGIQGLRLACCIWLTSLRLHNLLAAKSPTLQKMGLRTIAQLLTEGTNVLTVADLRQEWDRILEVNYSPIFHTARIALDDRIPDDVGADILTRLARLAGRITALRLGNRLDFAGELFPKLLEDREEIAAHYTLPETAELLSHLAVSRILVDNWKSADSVAALRIADLSCGTGTLLRAAYRHIRYRHEARGGTSEDLHQRMIEGSITGLDINSLASHMTAAGLSAAEIETEYHTARIAAVNIIGGRTGSLELIEEQQITDVTGERAQLATTQEAAPTLIPVPHQSLDLLIQNPPYSRARGERRLFNVAGISESQRQRSLRRLTSIRRRLHSEGNEITDGQAGLGADFFALADKKLRRDGVFASVLPLTAAHADSWKGFRSTVEREYRDITTIAFTPHEGAMLSADTHMNEMLVLATKGVRVGGETPSILNVNINISPQTAMEAFWFAKLLDHLDVDNHTSGIIYDAGMRIGTWTVTTPLRIGFPWFSVGMQSHTLAETAGLLLRGQLYSASDLRSWELDLPIVSLEDVVRIGPTHDLIGHPRDGDGRGAFTFDPVDSAEAQVATHPALWAAKSQSQRTLRTLATHDGTVATDDGAALRRMLDDRSDLFISRTLRTTSQALAAAKTSVPVMGGRAWTSLICDDDNVKSALLIWCNSTLGLLIRNCYAQTTQQGRATMQVGAIAGFPVPNFAEDSPAGEHARTVARDRIDELLELQLRPISYAFSDEHRQRIDSVVVDMLGLASDEVATQAVSRIRASLCREPSVHGSTKNIMRALGIPT